MCYLKKLLVIFIVANGAYVLAGGDKGNGGDGIILNDKRVVLFDLWERGVNEPKTLGLISDARLEVILREIPEKLF